MSMLPGSADSPVSGEARFQTTSWTLIVQAGAGPERRGAIERLCSLYWLPLYAYLRGSGRSRQDTEDLIQGFFVHLLERDILSYADRERGRFRTFLITALRQFLSRERTREQTQQRYPKGGFLPIDFDKAEEEVCRRIGASSSPEFDFDRVWALTLLDETLNTLREEYVRADKANLFSVLSQVLTGQEARSAREAAHTLNITEGAARVALHRLRQRYGVILRRKIKETLCNEDEVSDELSRLIQAIGR